MKGKNMNQNPETPSAVPDVKEEKWPPLCALCNHGPHPDSYGHSYLPREKKEAVAESVAALGEQGAVSGLRDVQERKSLSVILNEIELEVLRSREHCDFADTYGSALVKALRRAREYVTHDLRVRFDRDIAALLN